MFANWKTTLAGVLGAVSLVVIDILKGETTDLKTAAVAIVLAAVGALAKDHSADK